MRGPLGPFSLFSTLARPENSWLTCKWGFFSFAGHFFASRPLPRHPAGKHQTGKALQSLHNMATKLDLFVMDYDGEFREEDATGSVARH
jgi:hypothetical protein